MEPPKTRGIETRRGRGDRSHDPSFGWAPGPEYFGLAECLYFPFGNHA